MVLLEAEDLTFSYEGDGDGDGNVCLNQMSFQIEKGEFVLLFGPTGCGKSTLLKQWKPSLCPTGKRTGNVYFQGRNLELVSQREEASLIGYVSQNPDNQIVTDKVWHELAFTLENLGVPSAEIRSRVAETAVFFGMTEWFHKSIEELSGGQKQMLNLASVMITKPELLLLDEPTSQLDPIAMESFMNLLERIHRELGTTIFMVEHRLEEAYEKADRCMALEKGKVISFAKPCDVAKHLFLEKREGFELLPLQTRLPIYLKQEFSVRTVGEAKKFVEDNVKKVSKSDKGEGVNENQYLDDVLSFCNVWFRYEKKGKDIFRDFSITIKEGDFIGIIGANGQGKSTFLQLAAGIKRPYRGKVKKASAKNIAVLPQNPQTLFLKNTVKEELLVMGEDIDWIVKKLHLTEFLDRHPYDLSGGQQQLTALGKVLLTKPDILLLDEPTKGLDRIKKKKLGQLLTHLQTEGMTIILVSHDVDFCAAYARKIGMIFDGVLTGFTDCHSFFLPQYFFTTTCRKICREVYDGMISEEEVLEYEGYSVC
ncbi:ABC transporter ATP-binding protein [[Clostridium] polysaccharolyticum]|uniref:Energy-coupling factor transport system ATP-binding protein n=1 Tax=[Clostridium] polysaccharolyticum TaxID=29364 RepID=A0A1H9ZRV8_9FIRM|nr:ABC transporter ATP-binding protein [[Clostridium] polysaccharolyticum]SES83545.1 energy-coupling factor transport system ATP-binding protein [[Clostridium] polysaccharolyticum]